MSECESQSPISRGQNGLLFISEILDQLQYITIFNIGWGQHECWSSLVLSSHVFTNSTKFVLPSPVSLTSLLSSSTALLSSWFFLSKSAAETCRETLWPLSNVENATNVCHAAPAVEFLSGIMYRVLPYTVTTVWRERWARCGISPPLNIVHLSPTVTQTTRI